MQIEVYKTPDKGCGSFSVIKGDLIGDFINRYGYWEAHLVNIASLFLNKHSVIIDAGSNIGFHAVQFAKYGGKVYCFEPQKHIYELLKTNIKDNGGEYKVEAFNFGLYDSSTTLNMNSIDTCTDHNGQFNYGGLGVATDNKEGETIQLEVWDEKFSHIPKIDMLKMDIQGSEIHALKGMEKMLINSKPWILLENGDDETGKEVTDYLKGLGYEIFRPMEKLPTEDCICVHKNNGEHYEIRKFVQYISILPVTYKLL